MRIDAAPETATSRARYQCRARRQSHANNGNSSATGKAPSSSAYSAADTNGHSCSQDAHRQPPSLSASTSSASSSSSPKPANHHHHPNSKWTWAGYLLLLVVTKYTLPDELHTSAPTLKHVWFYGWVTALSTGVGAAPLILTHDLGKAMLAYGNAIAAGMMLSASFSLVSEGATVVEPEGFTAEWWAMFATFLGAPWARVVLGVAAGLVFILSTKKVGMHGVFLPFRRRWPYAYKMGRALSFYFFLLFKRAAAAAAAACGTQPTCVFDMFPLFLGMLACVCLSGEGAYELNISHSTCLTCNCRLLRWRTQVAGEIRGLDRVLESAALFPSPAHMA